MKCVVAWLWLWSFQSMPRLTHEWATSSQHQDTHEERKESLLHINISNFQQSGAKIKLQRREWTSMPCFYFPPPAPCCVWPGVPRTECDVLLFQTHSQHSFMWTLARLKKGRSKGSEEGQTERWGQGWTLRGREVIGLTCHFMFLLFQRHLTCLCWLGPTV